MKLVQAHLKFWGWLKGTSILVPRGVCFVAGLVSAGLTGCPRRYALVVATFVTLVLWLGAFT